MPLCSESIGISINIGDLTGISINISISLGICKVSVSLSVSIQGHPKYQYQSRYQLRAAQSISISIVSKNLVPSVSDIYHKRYASTLFLPYKKHIFQVIYLQNTPFKGIKGPSVGSL